MANTEFGYYRVKCSKCGLYDEIIGGIKTHKCTHCGYRNKLNYDEAIPIENPFVNLYSASDNQEFIIDEESVRKAKWTIAAWIFGIIAIILCSVLMCNPSSEESEKIEVQASVRTYIQMRLNDPGSYRTMGWDIQKTNTGFIVRHRYRAKNLFGGYVVEDCTVHLDKNYNVIAYY